MFARILNKVPLNQFSIGFENLFNCLKHKSTLNDFEKYLIILLKEVIHTYIHIYIHAYTLLLLLIIIEFYKMTKIRIS